MKQWNDFSDLEVEEQKTYRIIPKGTLTKVRMTINPGGYDDATRGWSGGYAKRNPSTLAVYLDAKFVILEGEYYHRIVWSKIGLHSEKSEDWGRMGRSFLRAILSSANGLSIYDNSEKAKHLRNVNSIADLDGLEFLAQIDIEITKDNLERNVIKRAVGAEHKSYTVLMDPSKRKLLPSTETKAKSLNPAWLQ